MEIIDVPEGACIDATIKRTILTQPHLNMEHDKRLVNLAELIRCASCDGFWKDLNPIIDTGELSERERTIYAGYVLDMMELSDKAEKTIKQVKHFENKTSSRILNKLLLPATLCITGSLIGLALDATNKTNNAYFTGTMSGFFAGYLLDRLTGFSDKITHIASDRLCDSYKKNMISLRERYLGLLKNEK